MISTHAVDNMVADIRSDRFHFAGFTPNQTWYGSLNSVAFDFADIKTKLLNLDQPCYIVRINDEIGVSNEGYISAIDNGKIGQAELLIATPPTSIQQLGDPNFLTFHQVKYAYATGAMAHGIASEDLVIALGKQKLLSSFGAGGLSPSRVEAAIKRIQQALPQGPYAFNLLHSPSEPAIDRKSVV